MKIYLTRIHSLAAGTLALGAMLASSGATAAIKCNDEYQIVAGQEIATPYCEDGYLARIARGYGVRVSDNEIRQNPNKKGEVCRFVGYDIRVREICHNYLNIDSDK